MNNLTITGYSTALFSTWFLIEELGILLDAGDGVSAGLTQKGGKVKHIFVSHADRDHLTGLFQFNQLNGRGGLPKIYYPKDCGSFPNMADFGTRFDPHVQPPEWVPAQSGDVIQVKNGIMVETVRNGHVKVGDHLHKSLSYKIFSVKRKLKKAFSTLSGEEIQKLIKEKGNEFITEEVRTDILGYSGDTPVEDYARWDGSDILIHEATFLDASERRSPSDRHNEHSTLPEVIQMVSEIKVSKLILSHFSTRYDHDQIDSEIKRLCKEHSIEIPVYRVLPGRVHRDVLEEEPING
ncbi:MAG: MBL fold metallo-hydrolase [Bacteroidota bacterium]